MSAGSDAYKSLPAGSRRCAGAGSTGKWGFSARKSRLLANSDARAELTRNRISNRMIFCRMSKLVVLGLDVSQARLPGQGCPISRKLSNGRSKQRTDRSIRWCTSSTASPGTGSVLSKKESRPPTGDNERILSRQPHRGRVDFT